MEYSNTSADKVITSF